MTGTPVLTRGAPSPAGHYSQGVVHGGLLFVAGQLGKDPARPDATPGTVEEQTERALRNVEAILHAAGSELSDLLSVTIFVAGSELWGRVNEVYARILGDARPARAIVPVNAFRGGWQVEIAAIAAVRSRG